MSVVEGPAKKELVQQGWRTFLVKVHNEAGVTAELQLESPTRRRSTCAATVARTPQTVEKLVTPADVAAALPRHRRCSTSSRSSRRSRGWRSNIASFSSTAATSGKREAKLGFDVGQGTQDLGFRNEVPILFDCVPAVEVVLDVIDDDGKPTTAAFVIRDKLGRVYPSRRGGWRPTSSSTTRSIAPTARSVHLPPGEYAVDVTRGPEYLVDTQTITVPAGGVSQQADVPARSAGFKLADARLVLGRSPRPRRRLRALRSPTEGVTPGRHDAAHPGRRPQRRLRPVVGPVLVLQKQFFEGKTSRALEAELPDAVRRRSLRASRRRTPGTSACCG